MIHLVFYPILTRNQYQSFYVKSEKELKRSIFDEKVRLYTWYFTQF